ncbi:hypothetical protein BDZ97DRAFT_331432 [Flammula alnicola]|nr:hypothetical protein BDZ97DRAFT_331432 [Flammula alnicola]
MQSALDSIGHSARRQRTAQNDHGAVIPVPRHEQRTAVSLTWIVFHCYSCPWRVKGGGGRGDLAVESSELCFLLEGSCEELGLHHETFSWGVLSSIFDSSECRGVIRRSDGGLLSGAMGLVDANSGTSLTCIYPVSSADAGRVGEARLCTAAADISGVESREDGSGDVCAGGVADDDDDGDNEYLDGEGCLLVQGSVLQIVDGSFGNLGNG